MMTTTPIIQERVMVGSRQHDMIEQYLRSSGASISETTVQYFSEADP